VIVKTANTYSARNGDPITFTICIINNTGAPVLIESITDTLPSTWTWSSPLCDITVRPDLACSQPATNTIAWGHPTLGSFVTLNPTERIDLKIHGSYSGIAAGTSVCNNAVADYKVTLSDGTVLGGNSPCIIIQP